MIPYLHKNSKYQPSPLNTDLLERTKVAMNNKNQEEHSSSINKDEDEHENDVVMPGFRFHPTEEELVEFYLRRKVEGKRFNVELISFLDLYRYDPWELPGLAAIGEKEWYFYVPRDRKYRNGDRPNRVTTSGYWKATGADRMIRSENSRSIGLKKTLVFYSGKAPKGVRTSWIMNEYRLPHHETELLQKAEISLCRVHKRAGVEDDPFLPRSFPTTPRPSSTSSSRVKYNEPTTHQQPMEESSFQPNYSEMSQRTSGKRISDTSPMAPNHTVDDLHKIVSSYSSPPPINHQHLYPNNKVPNLPNSHISVFQSQAQTETQPMVLNVVPGTAVQGGFSDRMWEWNAISEAGKDSYSNLFM